MCMCQGILTKIGKGNVKFHFGRHLVLVVLYFILVLQVVENSVSSGDCGFARNISKDLRVDTHTASSNNVSRTSFSCLVFLLFVP